jgi:hypothetical protein
MAQQFSNDNSLSNNSQNCSSGRSQYYKNRWEKERLTSSERIAAATHQLEYVIVQDEPFTLREKLEMEMNCLIDQCPDYTDNSISLYEVILEALMAIPKIPENIQLVADKVNNLYYALDQIDGHITKQNELIGNLVSIKDELFERLKSNLSPNNGGNSYNQTSPKYPSPTRSKNNPPSRGSKRLDNLRKSK